MDFKSTDFNSMDLNNMDYIPDPMDDRATKKMKHGHIYDSNMDIDNSEFHDMDSDMLDDTDMLNDTGLLYDSEIEDSAMNDSDPETEPAPPLTAIQGTFFSLPRELRHIILLQLVDFTELSQRVEDIRTKPASFQEEHALLTCYGRISTEIEAQRDVLRKVDDRGVPRGAWLEWCEDVGYVRRKWLVDSDRLFDEYSDRSDKWHDERLRASKVELRRWGAV